MIRSATILIVFALLLASCEVEAEAPPTPTPPPTLELDVNSVARSYHLHVPDSFQPGDEWPLVISLHGLGGHGSIMDRRTGFNAIADDEEFIVVYPNGFDGSWVDAGPDSLQQRLDAGIQDVQFIEELIDAIDAEYGVDPNRVYATGISNGALFSFHLACQLSERIAAVGLVAGASISQVYDDCAPSDSVSYLALHGTADVIVPYGGDEIAPGFPEIGRYQSAEEAFAFWVSHNNCEATPTTEELPDTTSGDNTHIIRTTYTECQDGTSVELYTIEGGGHTWPGHPVSSQLLGATNPDIDGSATLWEFFKAHPKP